MFVVTENHRTHGVTLQVQRHAVSVARELNHFTLHDIGQAVNTGDTIRHADNRTFSTGFGNNFEFLNSLFDQFADFCSA